MSDEKTLVDLDWFTASVFGAQAELTTESLDLLSEHAESYLKSCGSISWAEWRLLKGPARKAFELAGERIDAGRIMKIVDSVVERMSAKILDDISARSKWLT
jgi:hypothetical protein